MSSNTYDEHGKVTPAKNDEDHEHNLEQITSPLSALSERPAPGNALKYLRAQIKQRMKHLKLKDFDSLTSRVDKMIEAYRSDHGHVDEDLLPLLRRMTKLYHYAETHISDFRHWENARPKLVEFKRLFAGEDIRRTYMDRGDGPIWRAMKADMVEMGREDKKLEQKLLWERMDILEEHIQVIKEAKKETAEVEQMAEMMDEDDESSDGDVVMHDDDDEDSDEEMDVNEDGEIFVEIDGD